MPLLQAAYHGVPIVGMPIFGEQPDTVAQAVYQGFGLAVSVHKLRTLAADLEHALKRVLAEPSFATEAARVSRLMHSRRRLPAEIAAGELPQVSLVTYPAIPCDQLFQVFFLTRLIM